ncbi:hypothetical protein DL98DRAFT_615550 [Cadophora sp. DSE1049]|nr:hypothetical protein DL98DRAFT_615550 [Cadophora sp. DSE1049]
MSHALILGVSGISGCGIDFTKSVPDVVRLLKEKIPDVNTVSHVFFTAYVATSDFESLRRVNTSILETAIRSIEEVSEKLEVVILQTGGKGYGLEFPKEVNITPPLREDMPRIPQPYQDKIFYYTQYDMLTELSKGKSWTFTEIRPDGIVGFVPGSNAMNMAQGIALYLSLYKEVYGVGATVPFPGFEHGYNSTHSDTFQDILARMEIYAATNPKKCGNGGIFNIADDFVKENSKTWGAMVEKHGLDPAGMKFQNWAHVHFMLVQFDFDRQYDLSRAREVGFMEKVDTAKGYFTAWDRMKAAKIFP